MLGKGIMVKRERVRESFRRERKEIVRESERELSRNLEIKRTCEKESEG